MHALRHTLERLHRLRTRVVLQKANECEIEQCGRWTESLRGAGAEDLLRLVQHENRAQLPLEANPTRGEPSRLVEAPQPEQPRELVNAIRELDELPSRHYRDALAVREMVDRRLERGNL